MADFGILVTTPEPTAILSGYEFLKLAVRRKILSAFSGNPSVKEPLSALLSGAAPGRSARSTRSWNRCGTWTGKPRRRSARWSGR
jgi:MinD-like ATPase involved in chromosome partitioning or flagellar assembly